MDRCPNCYSDKISKTDKYYCEICGYQWSDYTIYTSHNTLELEKELNKLK
jgi:uncharacterized Zn finger protein (UPF0148 family)